MEEKEKCYSCEKNEAREPHSCPYASEISNSHAYCNCCAECTRECAMDI